MNERLYPRKLDLRHGRIKLSHGSGGKAMAQLIAEVFAPAFDNPWLAAGFILEEGLALWSPSRAPTRRNRCWQRCAPTRWAAMRQSSAPSTPIPTISFKCRPPSGDAGSSTGSRATSCHASADRPSGTDRS